MSADNNQWPPPQPGQNDDQRQWADETRTAPPLYDPAPPGPPGSWPATTGPAPSDGFGPPPADPAHGIVGGDPTVLHPPHQAPPHQAPYQQAPYQQAPYQAPQGVYQGPHDGLAPPASGPGGGRGLLLAGVLGGLATLGLVSAGVWALQGRDSGAGPTTESTSEPATEAGAGPTSTVDPRIGTSVAAIDLEVGDCINYDNSGGNIATVDIVACSDPHLSEIVAQIEHPAAGQDYPGVDELVAWSQNRCTDPANRYLGVDVLDTTLAATALLPDFGDWSQGLYLVNCMVGQFDESDLSGSVEGAAATFARGERVMVQRLKPGDCFSFSASAGSLALGRSDDVTLTDCSASPNGLFFGRDRLDFGSSEPFPGQDTIDSAAVALCETSFRRHFGADPAGFGYRYWSPGESTWIVGNRAVECAVLDEEGLRPNFDYASFPTLFEVEPGSCFHLPPDADIDSIDLDDRVEPVTCSDEFAGQIFASGTIETSGPFPGPDAMDEQILELCEARFTEFVGIPSADSAFGDFTFWVPTEEGWRGGQPRYLCAVLFEVPWSGSLEGSAS